MISAPAFYGEAHAMFENKSHSPLSALTSQGPNALNRTVQLVKLGVLVVSVAAAIPTAKNLYYSWSQGVPFDQVEHRLNQAALWERNFDCKIDYRALTTSVKTKVEVGSCSKTGDISIRVTGGGGQTNYEWIAFDKLPKPTTATAGLLDLFISQAVAGERDRTSGNATAAPIVVAQAGAEVVCQTKVKDMVVRVVKDGGKCFRETVSLFKGTVELREEVPCDTQCTN